MGNGPAVRVGLLAAQIGAAQGHVQFEFGDAELRPTAQKRSMVDGMRPCGALMAPQVLVLHLSAARRSPCPTSTSDPRLPSISFAGLGRKLMRHDLGQNARLRPARLEGLGKISGARPTTSSMHRNMRLFALHVSP